MVKKIIVGAMFLLNSFMVLAETVPGGEITLPESILTNGLQPILQKISFFVGGIFGIYVILILLQFYKERKKIKLLQDIRNDLDLLTKHFGVKHSHEKRGLFKRLFGFLRLEEKEMSKKIRK